MTSDFTFAPLALTTVLPFLPLSQSQVDYDVERRADPATLQILLQSEHTRVLLVRGSTIAVPRDPANLRNVTGRVRAVALPGPYLTEEMTAGSSSRIFLGTHDGVAFLALGLPLDNATLTAQQQALTERFDWLDLRDFAPRASALEAGLATSAVTVAAWQASQNFCPQCGFPVEQAHSGWAQRCTNPDHGRILFPRIEPAVITAIVDRDNRLLLQHNRAWKQPRLFSVTAGFVEAGESLEHAARREAKEEVGVTLGAVTYTGSQPWPFQGSLMLSFTGLARTTDITVDGDEVEEARWFTREEFVTALSSGEIDLPGKAAIARYQIQQWFGQEI